MLEAAQPAGDKPSAYLPAGPPDPLIFEDFEGINTATLRPGVPDKQAAWLDGFMPLGPARNLRTMYGVGPALFTATGADRIVFFDFFNIGATPYALVIVNTGEIYAVNTNTGAASSIAPDGTIASPVRTEVGLTQYGSQYVIICAQQPNGYWIWDGTTFYTPGGIGPGAVITSSGSGYTSSPTVSITGGSGSGATFHAVISGGVVIAVNVVTPGSGYLVTDTITMHFTSGGGSGAAATIGGVMPLGIGGSALEIYAGRVWMANGATVYFSAPGSVLNFSSGSGGGSFTSTDSFLRVSYIQLKQTSGFLYLIGDSSVNYISGVQTSGSPPVTTFTNQNVDPEVGSPWPATVDVFSRNILFANAFGAHVSYGGAVTKISEMLDGIYNTAPNFGNITPSACKAIVFGKKIWALLLPVIDPITGQQTNKLFCWNSKIWWATEQDITLVYVQHQEIGSVLTAYGTDGAALYPLFQQPSVNFTKVAQTKLWDKPGGYQFTKFVGRLWGIVKYYSALATTLNISIDNENSSNSNAVAAIPDAVNWVNNLGAVVQWLNNSGNPVAWVSNGGGYSVLAPAAVAQAGVLTGVTLTTNAADMAIITMQIQDSVAGYRG